MVSAKLFIRQMNINEARARPTPLVCGCFLNNMVDGPYGINGLKPDRTHTHAPPPPHPYFLEASHPVRTPIPPPGAQCFKARDSPSE